MLTDDLVNSLVSYFVVFATHGFSPSDLRRAQKAGDFFTSTSPDFINHAGKSIGAQDQVDALARAVSICKFSDPFIGRLFSITKSISFL